jgi:RNA polymerase sigma-70 factor (ECF subfamily)
VTTRDSDDLLARAVREEAAGVVASLQRRFRDFDVAEEAVQRAVAEALVAWRRDGPPDRPGAWLQTAARRNALDLLRSSERAGRLVQRAGAAAVVESEDTGTDDRLALLFACCHPALDPAARLALTLRAVVGLTTPQIARALLVPEATLAQRVVRAKRKVVAAGIALRVPDDDELAARLPDVLAVVYVMYNEAFVSTSGTSHDHDLGEDAVWLSGVVATSLPREPEAWGLAALLRFQHARTAARFDAAGDLVLLMDQDRSRWDHGLVAGAEQMLERASALRRPGPYQLQAAVAACHATARSWEQTDWLQVVTLYDLLTAMDPSPVVRLNRAVALAQLGPDRAAAALTEVDAIAERLPAYHLVHATRAELLRGLGRVDEAAEADRRALSLTENPAEQRLLRTRLRRYRLTDSW